MTGLNYNNYSIHIISNNLKGAFKLLLDLWASFNLRFSPAMRYYTAKANKTMLSWKNYKH